MEAYRGMSVCMNIEFLGTIKDT